MTSWKRLFGKKTKKAHRKLETRYEEWLKKLQKDYPTDSFDFHTQKGETDQKKKNN